MSDTLERRLRNTAERRGWMVVKNRRRDPRALGYGKFQLYDERGEPVFPTWVDLEQIEQALTGEGKLDDEKSENDGRSGG